MNAFARNFRTVQTALAMLALVGAGVAAQQKVEKSNMDLVGYSDLQARSAYQPTIQKQGERYRGPDGRSHVRQVHVFQDRSSLAPSGPGAPGSR